MKIFNVIIYWIKVNVMNDLSMPSTRDSAMLQDSRVSSLPSFTLGVESHTARFIGTLNCWASCGWRKFKSSSNRSRDITSSKLGSHWHMAQLFLIEKERISVQKPHLIMAHTHLPSSLWALAEFTVSAYDPASPSVLGRSMFLHSFVMHQAVSVPCVLASATFNRAKSHAHNITQWGSTYEAVGNYIAKEVIA